MYWLLSNTVWARFVEYLGRLLTRRLLFGNMYLLNLQSLANEFSFLEFFRISSKFIVRVDILCWVPYKYKESCWSANHVNFLASMRDSRIQHPQWKNVKFNNFWIYETLARNINMQWNNEDSWWNKIEILAFKISTWKLDEEVNGYYEEKYHLLDKCADFEVKYLIHHHIIVRIGFLSGEYWKDDEKSWNVLCFIYVMGSVHRDKFCCRTCVTRDIL